MGASLLPQAAAKTGPDYSSTAMLLNEVFLTRSDLASRIDALKSSIASLQQWATVIAEGYVSFGEPTTDQANIKAIKIINIQLNKARSQLRKARATVAALRAQADAVAGNTDTLVKSASAKARRNALAAAANTLYSVNVTVDDAGYFIGNIETQVEGARDRARYLTRAYVEHRRAAEDRANLDAANALRAGLSAAYTRVTEAKATTATLGTAVGSLILSLSETAPTTAAPVRIEAVVRAKGALEDAYGMVAAVQQQTADLQDRINGAMASLKPLATVTLTSEQTMALDAANTALTAANTAAADARRKTVAMQGQLDSTGMSLSSLEDATSVGGQWEALTTANESVHTADVTLADVEQLEDDAQAQADSANTQFWSISGPLVDGAIAEASFELGNAQVAIDELASSTGALQDALEAVDAQVQVMIDDVVADVADTPSLQLVPLPGGSYIYDAPVCEGQWFSVTTGTCTHADGPHALEDSYETFDQTYLDEVTYTGGYCRGQTNPAKYRVLYLYTGRGNSRLGSLLGALRGMARKADYFVWKSAQQQGQSRHIRYLCNSSGYIIVRAVRLPWRAREHEKTTRDLLRAWSGYRYDKRYVAFVDWTDSQNSISGTYCGWGEAYFWDDRPGVSNRNNDAGRITLTYLRPDICYNRGAGNVLHEVGHSLGALVESAPHERNGHALDNNDALETKAGQVLDACSSTVLNNRYDCQKNDYWNTDPTRPARGTYLADYEEYLTGKCKRVRDSNGVLRATECHWNAAWNRFLVGGG